MTAETSKLDDGTAAMFEPFEKKNLSARISDQILHLISDQRLSAGDRLPSERDLAIQLGVGRPTLREALSALTLMNVIEIRPGSGVYVSSLEVDTLAEPLEWIFALTESSIVQLFEVRLPLELHAVALASEHAKDADIADLVAHLDDMEAVDSDPAAWDRADSEFHTILAGLSGNPLLRQFVGVVNQLASRARRATYESVDAREATFKEHRVIVEAVASGDATRARSAMEAHLQHARIHLERYAIGEGRES